jgi:hypothetical protein
LRQLIPKENERIMNDSKKILKEPISTCEIAGAVVLCAVRDLRVNLFRFGGFPQIQVEQAAAGFEVRISVDGEHGAEARFLLSRMEARTAAKAFKRSQSQHDPAIFDRVQAALSRVVG